MPRVAEHAAGLKIHSTFDFGSDPNSILSHSDWGTVYKAVHRKSKQVFAVRQLRKKRLLSDAWQAECEALKSLDSPHVCKLLEMWEDSKHHYMVLEFCKGGDLTTLGTRRTAPNEATIAILMRQMVGGTAHIHRHEVVHGSLKMQHWLFADMVNEKSSPVQMQLKLVSFGFSFKHCLKASRDKADEHGEGEHCRKLHLKDQRGIVCQAPEQLDPNKKLVPATDVWALGVIAYFLLCGRAPFPYAHADSKVGQRLSAGKLEFVPEEMWRHVRSEAKSFVESCLRLLPEDRPPAQDLLNAPWMRFAHQSFEEGCKALAFPAQKGRLNVLDAPLPNGTGVLESFKAMHRFNALEKAAMTAVAYRLPPGKITQLRQTFERFDTNGDGVLTAAELHAGLKGAGIDVSGLMEILKDVDSDNSGVVEYTEFIAATYAFQHSMQEAALWNVFGIFDKDHSGKVSRGELGQILNDGTSEAKVVQSFPSLNVKDLLGALDQDGDGALDIDEFRELMQKCVDNKQLPDSSWA